MKKNIRQILSSILACGMMLSVLPTAVPTKVEAATSGASSGSSGGGGGSVVGTLATTTNLFKGNATYLIDDKFNGAMNNDFGGETIVTLSGWDVDNRGGRVYKYGNDLMVVDANAFESITMSRKMMKHTGDGLVLETAFKYLNYVTNGLYFEVLGDGEKSLRLFVESGYIYIQNPDGTKTKVIKCSANTFYHIRAEFSNSINKLNLWINGQSAGEFKYLEAADSIDEIKIGTTKEQMAEIVLDYVTAYVNYAVNETFMATPVGTTPAWWTATNGSTKTAPGAPYPADPNGYSLSSSGSLSRRFSPVSGKVSLGWTMLIPAAGASGFGFSTKSSDFREPVVSFEIDESGNFVVNNTDIGFSYKKNVWYKIELQIDTATHLADVYINNVLRKADIPFVYNEDDVYYIGFTNDGTSKILLDNIVVHKTFDSTEFADYPQVDEVVESDINLGMLFYPMWREGTHYGWELITPYEERTPYLGYYTGGSREVADWDMKWLLEHGFDHAIFPFARPDITAAGGQPSFSVRGEALHDGYLNSVYKDKVDFAIMLTNPTNEKLDNATEFITNVVPYLVEHYFRNPSYKSVDNRLLVYNYNAAGFAEFLGGASALNSVLEAIDAEVKKIDNPDGGKYDGITFICDISAGGVDTFDTLKEISSIKNNIYKWRYTWGSDKYANIVNGIKTDYADDNASVASIPMGFDNIPWKYNEVGIIPPAGVEEICKAVVSDKTDADPNIAVFTCWDEWGEGHFFAPSNIHGFDYLNVARKIFSTSGEKTNQDRPTQTAIKRMGVLYPENRQILKIKKDRVETTADDLANLTSLGKITLKSTRGSVGNCNRSWISPYTYTISGSPATVTYSSLSKHGIDLSKVTAVRIKGYAQNSSTMVLYTTSTTNSDINNTDFRFEGKCDGGNTTVDTILFPDNPGKTTGTLTEMRFNPTAGTSNGSKFYLEEIEFYTGKMRTTVTVDDEEVDLVSPVQSSDTVYIPAYKLLLDLDAYVLWDKQSKTLTAEKDGVTVKLTDGSKVMEVNGEDKNLSYAPYYEEGNLFIPYSGVLEEFGYTTRNDVANKNIGIYSSSYEAKKNYVTDGNWYFDTDGFAEGWDGAGVLKPMTVSDGMLQLFAKTKDPILTIDDINIPKNKALYAVLRIKKTDSAEAGMLRLYDDTTNDTGVVYRFNLTPSNDVQEIVFNLATDATVNSTYTNTYAQLSKITKIRLDPMDNYGSILIDSIRITDNLKTKDFELEAYGFETTNMLQLDTEKTGFKYTNALNSAGNSDAEVLPATETVDEYNNVIKVVPTSGNREGLLSLEYVYYKGSKQKVDAVCNDNRIVKVSFWYKGIGDCTALRFENRQGGMRDGEEFNINDISNTEWKYFEDYIDMSNESGSGRWFTLRVTTSGTAAHSGIYLRDYKLVCLDETTAVSKTSGDTVAVKIKKINGDATVEGDGVKVLFADYDSYGKMNGAEMIDYQSRTAKYHFFKPSSAAANIKCFFMKNLTPLSEVLVLPNN